MKRANGAAALCAVATLFAIGGLVQAGQTEALRGAAQDTRQHLQQVPVERYHYGMKLDIARVLFISDTSQVCGVVPSVMQYEDSKGELRALEYLIHGGGCFDN